MNVEIFRALSSKTRQKMLKLLGQRKFHISGLAREMGISVPVVAKHAKILEAAGLVEREEFGGTHVLRVLRKNKERLYEVLEPFSEEHEIEVQKGTSILEALQTVAGVRMKRVGEREFIASIDGEEGFFVYEVNGKCPDLPVGECKVEKEEEIKIKRLVPVLKKRVRVKVRENKIRL